MEDTYYDGASTGAQIDDTVQKGIVQVNCGTITSLPFTKSNANILASHVVLNAVLNNPAAQVGTWTVVTSNGSLTVSGTINGSTTLTLYLGRAAQTIS